MPAIRRHIARPGTLAAVVVIALSGCANQSDESGDADGAPASDTPQLTGNSNGNGNDDDRQHNEPDPSDSPSPSENDREADQESKTDVSVQIEIAEGEISPPPGRTSVTAGQTVRIEVSGDQADTVHVHGYDVEADISPASPAVVEFTADQPGLFDVETHESGLLLTQLVVE